MGTPGFTIAIFIHSLPMSTDMTATVAENRETVALLKTYMQSSGSQMPTNNNNGQHVFICEATLLCVHADELHYLCEKATLPGQGRRKQAAPASYPPW